MSALIEKHPQAAGALLTALGGIGWGVSGTCGQYLFTQKGVTSFWLVPLRLLLAGILLLSWEAVKNPRQLLGPWRSKEDRTQLLIYGLAGITLCQLSYFGTIQLSTAGVATILQSLSPVFILLYTCRAVRRRPAGREVGSIVLALAGVCLIATHGRLNDLAVSPQALAVGTLSAFTVMIYNVRPAWFLRRWPAPLLQGWSFLMGGLLLCAVFRPWQYPVALDAGVLAGLAGVILLGNLIAFNCYMTGVRLIGPGKGILYGFSEPVAAAVCSSVWLGAPFTGWDAAGFACIFLTLALLNAPARRARAEQPARQTG